uniref:Uncharacterized protein n=1 Tax=Arundo donax TaxID=35708 RepID=A0A0A9BXC4_ARUDO
MSLKLLWRKNFSAFLVCCLSMALKFMRNDSRTTIYTQLMYNHVFKPSDVFMSFHLILTVRS